jgi:hypothetical protein
MQHHTMAHLQEHRFVGSRIRMIPDLRRFESSTEHRIGCHSATANSTPPLEVLS